MIAAGLAIRSASIAVPWITTHDAEAMLRSIDSIYPMY